MIIGGRAHNVEEAEAIGKAGLPFAEISILDPKMFYERDYPVFKKLSDLYGLTYLAHGPEEGNAWEPDILRNFFLPQIRVLLDCAGELSIPVFTTHFWMDKRFIEKEIIEKKISILEEMALYAAQKGIRLCIENLSEQISDFSRAFDVIKTLGMTLDIGHGELLTKKNTAYDFSQHCFERIWHMHIHDNRGGSSPRDDLHLPLGDGTINFAPILHAFKKKGYDKTITLEVKPEHLRASRKVLEEIWNG